SPSWFPSGVPFRKNASALQRGVPAGFGATRLLRSGAGAAKGEPGDVQRGQASDRDDEGAGLPALGTGTLHENTRSHKGFTVLNDYRQTDRFSRGSSVVAMLWIVLHRPVEPAAVIGMYGPPLRRKRNLRMSQVGLRKCIRPLLEWITPGQDGMRCALFPINWSVLRD